MSQKRRKFSPHFKSEAVQFVIQTGRPVSEIAKELEIHEGTLGLGQAVERRESGAGKGFDSYGKGRGLRRWKMRFAGSEWRTSS